MTPHGGARAGAGRKKNEDITKQGSVAARLFPPDADTLKSFGNTASVLTLLAQGLRLGEGNLPPLTVDEQECLHALLLTVWVDVTFIRHLRDEIEDFDHPAQASLLKKLESAGDLELLALIMRQPAFPRLQLMHGSI